MANYLKKADFNKIVTDYQADPCKANSDAAFLTFHLLASRYSEKLFKIFDMDREDFVTDSAIECFKKVKNYDPAKADAFCYFTSIVHNKLLHLSIRRNYCSRQRANFGKLAEEQKNSRPRKPKAKRRSPLFAEDGGLIESDTEFHEAFTIYESTGIKQSPVNMKRLAFFIMK